MRAVIQRVSQASVTIDNKIYSSIKQGVVVLLGIESNDTYEDSQWLANKIINLRIFNDENHQMNHSVDTIDGEIMVVSQFTLYAQTKKGNRPSYIKAAPPKESIIKYDEFIHLMNSLYKKEIKTGIFGAQMSVQLINDGPVTIIIDTKNKE